MVDVFIPTASLPIANSKPTGDAPLQSVEDVYRRCRDLGMRLSRQRRMVLDLLWAEKTHLSARDIFDALQGSIAGRLRVSDGQTRGGNEDVDHSKQRVL